MEPDERIEALEKRIAELESLAQPITSDEKTRYRETRRAFVERLAKQNVKFTQAICVALAEKFGVTPGTVRQDVAYATAQRPTELSVLAEIRKIQLDNNPEA